MTYQGPERRKGDETKFFAYPHVNLMSRQGITGKERRDQKPKKSVEEWERHFRSYSFSHKLTDEEIEFLATDTFNCLTYGIEP